MLFSQGPRVHYRSAPVREVICQLTFPTILRINGEEPAEFQESVRGAFPQYLRRQDPLPPQRAGTPPPQPVTNYHFLTADGKWRLNLTKDFIALSTLAYPGWEEFARHLDKPLASFIHLYQPAYFQRVGLRYVNVFSRSQLGLEGHPWTELFTPAYLGPLLEEDVREEDVAGCGCDFVLKLDSSCRVKVHTSTGQLRQSGSSAPPSPEVKLLFDMDLSMGGNVPCTLAAGALETLHGHGNRVFEGAITDTLRGSMGAD